MKINLSKLVRVVEKIENAKVQATGFIGEAVFNTIAKKYLNEDYKVMSDVVLSINNGTTQIDQIIVSIFGIFVVEVKTYKGWIFGNKENAKWTQALYNTKNTFQNPLRQNYKHIKALQDVLGFPENKFKSLIVFSGEAKFKTPMPDNVVRGAQDYINYILQHREAFFQKNEVEEVVNKISVERLSSAEHQAYMKMTKERYEKSDKNNPPLCPKCNKKMVLRTSKKGHYKGRQFWGCSAYPHCRAIVNIKDKNKQKKEHQTKMMKKTFNLFFE
ncbi:NERD domain-containing protein [Desulfococcaceae bacterium HSG9]|nr:NERD domain-containing protein [Desulfococcaceae bacterium HSG9]